MGGASAKLATLVHDVLDQGIRAGELRPNLDVGLTTTLIMRTASAARDQLEHGNADARELADTTLALLLGGIQATPPTSHAAGRDSRPRGRRAAREDSRGQER
jgi:hypothetical protein